MKNIHVLPTDKPSRLHLAFEKMFISSVEYTSKSELYKSIPQNIYITSDEEIKEADWFINELGQLWQHNGIVKPYRGSKKIILTTDQDLIKDGVQSIGDDFLEWFVRNPSCEYVKTTNYFEYFGEEESIRYKIIIPKEEPKQETLLQIANRKLMSNDWLNGAEFGAKWQEQQTIEEVFEWLTTNNYLTDLKETLIKNFKNK